MSKEIRTIRPDTLAQESAATLNKFKINSVIVFQKERSVDIIIVREVLNRLVEKSAAPRMLIARYAMTTPFTTINKGPAMDEAGKSLGKTNVKPTSVMEKKTILLAIVSHRYRFQIPKLLSLLEKARSPNSRPFTIYKNTFLITGNLASFGFP